MPEDAPLLFAIAGLNASLSGLAGLAGLRRPAAPHHAGLRPDAGELG